MSAKYALIIANTDYNDPGLAKLSAPGRDADEFARVLKSPDICGFDDVNVLLNQLSAVVSEAIDEFFDQKKPDDLLVLYFSGHGVRDEQGALYLAVTNTNRYRLRSTAIKSDFIRESMDQSRSKRQVLILDCCNSGAFAQGTKAATGVSIGTSSAFEGSGYGHMVLTASDSTQFAWEGDKVIGQTENSLFTHFLVKGLEGEADSDGDGRITINELYDYAYEQIVRVTPKQTPSKWSYKEQGEITLRESTRMEDIRSVPLPSDLIDEIDDTRPYVREVAVQKLEKILKGRNIGLARSAREALEKIIADDNTTRRVAQMATHVLDSIWTIEQKAEEEQKAREETERLEMLKTEEERLAYTKAEAERNAREEAERLLAICKAEEERLGHEKAVAESKAKEEPQHVLTKKAIPSKNSLKSPIGIGMIIIIAVIVLGAIGLNIVSSGDQSRNPPASLTTSLTPSEVPFPTATPNQENILQGTKVTYIVQMGDSLAGIASKFNSTVDDIVKTNNLTDANSIFVGQQLQIRVNLVTPTSMLTPSAPFTYTIQGGDTLQAIATKFGLGDDGIQLILLLNPYDPKTGNGINPLTWFVYPGQQITIPNPGMPLPISTPGTAVPTATPVAGTMYDFAANVCSGVWYSGLGQLHCPGTDGDSKGFVLRVSNPQLENGTFDVRQGLITFPQNINNGYIQGIFPPYHVKPGDRFRSIINCAHGSTSCYVVFRLDYQTGTGPITTFWAFVEKNDGQYYQADLDLSSLVGQDIKFILTALAPGSPTGSRALWVAPMIYNVSFTFTPVPVTATTLN